MNRVLAIILCVIISIFLTVMVDLQFLDWPFSAENNKFVMIVGVVMWGLGSIPFIFFNSASLKRRIVTSTVIIFICVFIYYVFNLVLFTI